LRYPGVRAAVERLAGRISVADMRAMNQAVDAGRQDPAAVARDFLARLEREHPSKG
jgi:glycine betaine/choline ABC-type transport system substrate-binding protein